MPYIAQHTYVTDHHESRHRAVEKIMANQGGKRTEKIQLMLNDEEIRAIDDWRFENRLPSRAAAIRELISRGLHTNEFGEPTEGKPSGGFTVITPPDEGN